MQGHLRKETKITMGNFIIRTFKAWNSNEIERAWSNTYEVVTDDESVTALGAMAQVIVDAERILHLPAVNFLQYTVSTWTPDSQPYDPATFFTAGVGTFGSRAPANWADTALDYNVCFMVHRNAATGRTGRLYYRGVLTEADVKQGGSGRFAFETVGDVTQRASGTPFNSYATLLAPFVGSGNSTNKLALISKRNTVQLLMYVRPVASLTLGGVVINKKNHRYFDRANV